MISKFSVRKPYTVLVGVVLAIILGVVSFTRMTADLLPNISLPYVIVMTTYPGASPETVEMAVTQPVEAAMATVSNIEGISSVSSENYSMVILEFSQTADMNAISLEIRESLDQIKSYWDDSIGNPIIMKMNPDMLPVMIAAVGMEGMDPGEISIYVQDSIVPELESIEGVASVNATGLLEESVNVIIRQEKIDEVNRKVYAVIDDQMADAEQELADGRKELEDGKKELEDGRKDLLKAQRELANGKSELNDGKQELENGKTELEKKQDETAKQLAAQKTALLTAKTNLESIRTNLATAAGLHDGIKKIDEGIAALEGMKPSVSASVNALQSDLKDAGAPDAYGEALQKQAKALAELAVSSGDAQAAAELEEARNEINGLKAIVTGNAILGQFWGQISGMAGVPGATLPSMEELKAMDWTAPDSAGTVGMVLTIVCDNMFAPAINAGLDAQIADLENQKEALKTQFEHATGGVAYDDDDGRGDNKSHGYEKYVKQINQILAAQKITDLNKAIEDINNGLILLEQGQMTAAVEFANGKAQIALGEYQLEVAEAELTSGEEQIKSGLEQMEDAKKQLDDAEEQLTEGEKQLAEAKEKAYDQADMSKVMTVDTVKGLLTAQNFSMPAGYVTEEGIDYMVRVGDKPSTAEELQELPLLDLHMDGVPVITLGDVADVFYTDNSAEIYTNVDGSAGVMLTIQKQTGYSTGEVSDLLAERFEELTGENPGLSLITLMDQGIYIDLVMDSIFNNIIFGFGLAVLILILFLKDLRPTAIVAVSVPISLVTAVVCMYFSGVTLNIISLSGLALGIGMLVDNSIVVIENIYRLRGLGSDVREAAMEGAREVAGAIVASTLTTVCVFLPIVFTEGITRQLFVDMGLTIAYSLLASLVIALTVVPAMASKILVKTREQKEGKFFRALVNGYEKVLAFSLKWKPLVLTAVLLLLAASIALAYTNGTAFMTDMDSTQLTVSVQLEDDATLAETGAVTDRVVEAILSIDDVRNVGAMTSTSTLSLLGGGGGSTNAATIYVVTVEDKTRSNEEIAELILEKTADLDAQITVDTSSMDMSALGGSGISIQVRGRELDELQRIAEEVAAVVESVEGTARVSDGLEETEEELRVVIDREKAVRYGLTVAQVYSQIYGRLAEAGSATTLVAADRDYNVYVMDGNDIELTRALLREISITGTDENGENAEIPLEEIASFEAAAALTSINRQDQSRYVTVSAAIADGYNVGLVSADVERKLASYEMPAGYRLVFSGENEMINDAMGQVLLMLALAVAFMYLIMVAQFQSLKSPFIIMFTIPLAFTGGFLGLFISGSEISVIAMIGFVMLAGIIVNNGIVLIDYINQLRERSMDKRTAILEAGRTRLRPVLMTALTTILALSTMVFSNDMGSEMAKPMAVVTIGGLIYGTLLTLIVIPCVYDIFEREKKNGGAAKRMRRQRGGKAGLLEEE
ncbi:MAG: efflux RND transporter permease subunit [bacterium]|nr:efflux RND transporter permease subunit [bacterium]